MRDRHQEEGTGLSPIFPYTTCQHRPSSRCITFGQCLCRSWKTYTGLPEKALHHRRKRPSGVYRICDRFQPGSLLRLHQSFPFHPGARTVVFREGRSWSSDHRLTPREEPIHGRCVLQVNLRGGTFSAKEVKTFRSSKFQIGGDRVDVTAYLGYPGSEVECRSWPADLLLQI